MWKWTGWGLVALYLWTAFCAPWLPASLAYYRLVNEAHSRSDGEPVHSTLPALTLPLSSAEQELAKSCARSFLCSWVDYRTIRIIDVGTDDPVALFTIVLAASTIGLWIQTWRLAKGADSQARDIQGQLAVARDDFISTHRPWVGFEAKIGAKGLRYVNDKVHLDLMFTCKNTGTTPAIGVSVNVKTWLWGPFPSDVVQQRQFCKAQNCPADAPTAMGKSIFPGEKEAILVTLTLEKGDLDKYTAGSQKIFITVAGCVDYAFSFGDNKDQHQSGFIYYVGKDNAGALDTIVVADGDLTPAKLNIRKAVYSGAFFAC
jgi:hypothetical protein